MFFVVSRAGIPTDQPNRAVLIPDNWDDWFKFETTFILCLVLDDFRTIRVGAVKIGHMGLQGGREMAPGIRGPNIPEHFDQLPPQYFSLGTSEDYYENLNTVSQALRQRVLTGLRDAAYDLNIFQAAASEPSMVNSLLRSISAQAVVGRLNRLSHGNAERTPFAFRYAIQPAAANIPSPILTFNVAPEVEPPTNVHVLIGRNGAGKTRLMRHMAEALLNKPETPEDARGTISFENELDAAATGFAGLVLVSFSAFDNYTLQPSETDRIPFVQVGLRHRVVVDGVESGGLKEPAQLATDFRLSLDKCRTGLRADRWKAAVQTLETDDLFMEANVVGLLDVPEEQRRDVIERYFTRLSSGHAIVLLTITKLVELVDEQTMVLLDEPEGHLHPPLLAAFIRSLSDLLVKRNGVAVIATHSPVVLQEVPRHCAWKIRRSGHVSAADRPVVETFGENVGILTREVFGLEVTRSGFHSLLEGAVRSGSTYEQILARFNGQLGLEARAIVHGLIAERDRLA